MTTSIPEPDAYERSPDLPLTHLDPRRELLDQIDDIHRVLLEDAKQNPGTNPRLQDSPMEKVGLLTWLGAIAGLLLVQVPFWPAWLALILAVATLLLVAVSLSAGAVSSYREWKRRRVDTLQRFQAASKHERQLVEQLFLYSRAALLHVAASARAADGRVGSRIAFFLGPNRAGGALGALFLIFGVFSAGKYLQDNAVQLPLLGAQVTADHVLVAGLGLLGLALALLFAGASVNSLNRTADLLERVATLKKDHAEDEKMEQGR
ncbi:MULTISPECIES: hypothetical protein [Deinococcus]|uniref:hypothetical protein n=1 Tax=Deinococcus TaxID=1298 RepID=UPI001319D383|nr:MULTISPECIES: hypothetical protein [Deinococcus]